MEYAKLSAFLLKTKTFNSGVVGLYLIGEHS